MAARVDSMTNPPIENLLDKVETKFELVTLAAKRAREINDYFNQLGSGIGSVIPPQVASTARKPLSVAFEEIAEDKIVQVEPSELEAEAGTDADAAVDGDAEPEA